jgi:hypothetical protein
MCIDQVRVQHSSAAAVEQQCARVPVALQGSSSLQQQRARAANLRCNNNNNSTTWPYSCTLPCLQTRFFRTREPAALRCTGNHGRRVQLAHAVVAVGAGF